MKQEGNTVDDGCPLCGEKTVNGCRTECGCEISNKEAVSDMYSYDPTDFGEDYSDDTSGEKSALPEYPYDIPDISSIKSETLDGSDDTKEFKRSFNKLPKLRSNFASHQWGIVSPTDGEDGTRRLRGGGHR
ncbi:MAG: hypothetical protein LUI05_05785 [Oscillospiraceae bacterium]|nr:hypothetical protein [Oscillospiraceae bacterium]